MHICASHCQGIFASICKYWQTQMTQSGLLHPLVNLIQSKRIYAVAITTVVTGLSFHSSPRAVLQRDPQTDKFL